jgi:ACS family pantothenate transporter-like MFS transporter
MKDVSGMKEDLGIKGNEYTYMGSCYAIAFAIMQVPSNMIAFKIKPRYCLVACELGWTTIFTFAQAAAQNSGHMYAYLLELGSLVHLYDGEGTRLTPSL